MRGFWMTAALVAAAMLSGSGDAAAQDAYRHDAADTRTLETFRDGMLALPRRELYNFLPARVEMAAQRVNQDACWGPYDRMRTARERAASSGADISDLSQRAAAAAEADYAACMRSFRAQLGQMVAAGMLATIDPSVYIGEIGTSADRNQAHERVNLLCDNTDLVPDADACRHWFLAQFTALDRQLRPDGGTRSPRATSAGTTLFGPQGNGNGLVWQMLGAFRNGNTVSLPGGGGAVPVGR